MGSFDQTVSMRPTQDQLEEIRARLAQRPPDAVLTAAEAAIYTGRSTRTLKRAIDAGVGPRREKNPDVSGLAATNRHTRYRKADLDAWRNGLVGFATSFRSFDDLAADAPWAVDGGMIAGHLLDLDSIDAILDALRTEGVEFLRLDEALAQQWQDAEVRQRYQEALQAICVQTMQLTAAAAQHDGLEAGTGEAAGQSEPTRL